LEGTFDRVGSTLVGKTDGDAVGRGADGDRVVNDRVWLMKANAKTIQIIVERSMFDLIFLWVVDLTSQYEVGCNIWKPSPNSVKRAGPGTISLFLQVFGTRPGSGYDPRLCTCIMASLIIDHIKIVNSLSNISKIGRM